jgi:hypothetical protein
MDYFLVAMPDGKPVPAFPGIVFPVALPRRATTRTIARAWGHRAGVVARPAVRRERRIG